MSTASHGVPYSGTERRDPLYGRICLPSYLDNLLICWEIERLRYVRLLNVNSVPLSTLGETSRYSHTIGVLWLASVFLNAHGISPEAEEARLLFCSLALHDAGTPAFGHSLEYVLKIEGMGDHVSAVISAVQGQSASGPFLWSAAPDKGSHRGLRAELKKLLGSGFEDKIHQTLLGQGIVGKLVASAIDLDNIDNVFRMAMSIGERIDPRDPVLLAASLEFGGLDSTLRITEAAVDCIQRWAIFRRLVYGFLNRHPQNLAGLSMLREIFEEFSLAGGLNSKDERASAWWTADHEILSAVKQKHTEPLIAKFQSGHLDQTIAYLHLNTDSEILQAIEEAPKELRGLSYRLSNVLGHPLRVHGILDRGTFERSISLELDDGQRRIMLGKNSRSIILSVHCRQWHEPPPSEIVRQELLALIADWYKISPAAVSMAVVAKHPTSTVFDAPRSANEQLSLFTMGVKDS